MNKDTLSARLKYYKMDLQKNTLLIFNQINGLIKDTRIRVAVSVNSELTILYYKVGYFINNFFLTKSRAPYGQQILIKLAEMLTDNYGKGWSEKQLRH